MAATSQARRIEKLIEATVASMEREGFDPDAPLDPTDPHTATIRQIVRQTAVTFAITEHLTKASHAIMGSVRDLAWDAFVSGNITAKDTR